MGDKVKEESLKVKTYSTKIFLSIEPLKRFLESNTNSIFMSYSWLKAVESSNIGAEPRHIGVYLDGGLVAVAPCYIQHEELLDTVDRILFGKFSGLANKISRFKPSLVCYSPVSHFAGVIGKIDKGIVKAILHCMIGICKKEAIKCYCFPYVPEGKLSDMLDHSGLVKCYLFDNNMLKLGVTLEDYKLRLSRNMRKNINHEINSLRKEKAEVLFTENLEAYAGEVASLYDKIYKKHAGKPSILSQDFFKILSSRLKGKLLLVMIKKESKAIAFSLLIKDGKTLHAYKTGYIQGYPFLYFNVFYNLPIKYACEQGFKRIDFGPTLSKLKSRRGCSQIPLYAFFGFNTKFSGTMTRAYIKLLDAKKRILKPGQ
jgi:predicted N-acyltransferase